MKNGLNHQVAKARREAGLTGRAAAFTVVELLLVVAVSIIALVVLLPAFRKAKTGSHPTCQNNLRQIGIGFRTWEGDYGNRYPMSVPDDSNGAMESCLHGNSYRAFQVLSDQINNLRYLVCPADNSRQPAISFTNLRGANIGYFLGIDADEAYPTRILSGDRNILCDLKPTNGILNLTAGHPVQWEPKRHNGFGNILLSDGSVQQTDTRSLNNFLTNTGLATNRIALP